MEKYEEMFEKLTTDEELGKKIGEIEAKYAPVKQLAEAFAEAGIEVHEDDVKRFMAYFQMKRFEAITETELDEDLLKQVAGGTMWCHENSAKCTSSYSVKTYCYSFREMFYDCGSGASE